MNMRQCIGIIIPSLDPDDKILDLIENLKDHGFEKIIIVNDGSCEKYDKYYDQAQCEYGCVVLKHNVNQGKGRALKSSFNYILNERLDLVGAVTVDSDGQHMIDDIERCCEVLYNNLDKLVFGARSFDDKNVKIPFRSKFGNVLTHKFLKWICKINLSDTQTGLRGFSRKLMKTFLATSGEKFEYEMNMILDAKKNHIDLLEAPIKTVYIEKNETLHFNPIMDSIKIYFVLFKFMLSSSILKFMCSSGFSFLIDIGLFTILFNSFKNIIASTYISRCVSAVVNYLINKNKVFKDESKSLKSAVKYFVLCVFQATLSAFSTWTLSKFLNLYAPIIKVFVEITLFFISFNLQKSWVFKKGDADDKK